MIVLLFYSNINNAWTDLNITFLTLSHGIHIRWQKHKICTNMSNTNTLWHVCKALLIQIAQYQIVL